MEQGEDSIKTVNIKRKSGSSCLGVSGPSKKPKVIDLANGEECYRTLQRLLSGTSQSSPRQEEKADVTINYSGVEPIDDVLNRLLEITDDDVLNNDDQLKLKGFRCNEGRDPDDEQRKPSDDALEIKEKGESGEATSHCDKAGMEEVLNAPVDDEKEEASTGDADKVCKLQYLVSQLKNVEGFQNESWGKATTLTHDEKSCFYPSEVIPDEQKNRNFQEFMEEDFHFEEDNNGAEEIDQHECVDFDTNYTFKSQDIASQNDDYGGEDVTRLQEDAHNAEMEESLEIPYDSYFDMDLNKVPDALITSDFVLDYVLHDFPISVPEASHCLASTELDSATNVAEEHSGLQLQPPATSSKKGDVIDALESDKTVQRKNDGQNDCDLVVGDSSRSQDESLNSCTDNLAKNEAHDESKNCGLDLCPWGFQLKPLRIVVSRLQQSVVEKIMQGKPEKRSNDDNGDSVVEGELKVESNGAVGGEGETNIIEKVRFEHEKQQAENAGTEDKGHLGEGNECGDDKRRSGKRNGFSTPGTLLKTSAIKEILRQQLAAFKASKNLKKSDEMTEDALQTDTTVILTATSGQESDPDTSSPSTSEEVKSTGEQISEAVSRKPKHPGRKKKTGPNQFAKTNKVSLVVEASSVPAHEDVETNQGNGSIKSKVVTSEVPPPSVNAGSKSQSLPKRRGRKPKIDQRVTIDKSTVPALRDVKTRIEDESLTPNHVVKSEESSSLEPQSKTQPVPKKRGRKKKVDVNQITEANAKSLKLEASSNNDNETTLTENQCSESGPSQTSNKYPLRNPQRLDTRTPYARRNRKTESKIDYVKQMTEEMKKTNVDLEILSEAMTQTYKTRRKFVENPDTDVATIVKKFPALNHYIMVKEEYGRVHDDNDKMKSLEKDLEGLSKEALQLKPRRFAFQHPILKAAKKLWKPDCTDPKLQQVLGMFALCFHFSEKAVVSSLCRLLEEDEELEEETVNKMITPTLVMKRSDIFLVETEGWIYVEAEKYLRVPNFYEGVILVYAIYYVFNLCYDSKLKSLFEFFDMINGDPQKTYTKTTKSLLGDLVLE